jgi:hypothetical protein
VTPATHWVRPDVVSGHSSTGLRFTVTVDDPDCVPGLVYEVVFFPFAVVRFGVLRVVRLYA